MRSIADIVRDLERGAALRLLGLGDSLTYGWAVERGFFDRFIDGLEKRFPRARIERRNAGVPGDTAPGGLERLQSLGATASDLAVVQFGLNDCFAGVSLEAFGDALEAIGRALLEGDCLPVMATSCPLASLHDSVRARPYYDMILSVAGRLDIPAAELDRSWEVAASRFGEPLWGPDGVHPTDAGHARMADGLLVLFTSNESPEEA
ncbi:MAG: SGNH/GDSL hydrolase family protein [Deltaproteobacteria bacterium]|nr:SGNH/GDSL hydrolase family protein [Deltaproteobacteria bacterium]